MLNDNLNVKSSLSDLEMVLKREFIEIIHHSDRDLQYCSNEYRRLFIREESCFTKYNPYENAIEERINGVLKQEFDIDKYDTNLKVKTKLVENSVEIHNNIRFHLSNYMLLPNQIHKQNNIKTKK